MLAINPTLVKFGDVEWTDVTLVAIDRAATKLVAEWTDRGPHAGFVDAPEQRVDVKIARAVARDDLGDPKPGQSGVVVFLTSPGGTDAARKRVSFTGVVTAVRHEISSKGATRIVQLVAVSADGAADPITIADAGGEA